MRFTSMVRLMAAAAITAVVAAATPSLAGSNLEELGHPRRNVVNKRRPVEQILAPAGAWKPLGTGSIPVMVFPTGNLIVEHVWPTMATEQACKDAFTSYNKAQLSQYGAKKVQHALYCAQVENGAVKKVVTVVKSF